MIEQTGGLWTQQQQQMAKREPLQNVTNVTQGYCGEANRMPGASAYSKSQQQAASHLAAHAMHAQPAQNHAGAGYPNVAQLMLQRQTMGKLVPNGVVQKQIVDITQQQYAIKQQMQQKLKMQQHMNASHPMQQQQVQHMLASRQLPQQQMQQQQMLHRQMQQQQMLQQQMRHQQRQQQQLQYQQMQQQQMQKAVASQHAQQQHLTASHELEQQMQQHQMQKAVASQNAQQQHLTASHEHEQQMQQQQMQNAVASQHAQQQHLTASHEHEQQMQQKQMQQQQMQNAVASQQMQQQQMQQQQMQNAVASQHAQQQHLTASHEHEQHFTQPGSSFQLQPFQSGSALHQNQDMTEATKIRQVPPPPPKQAEGAKQSNSCQGDDVHITPSSTPLKGAEIWSPMACSPMMVSPVAKPDSVEPDARDSSGEGAGYQNMVDELREQLASMEQQSADADGTDPCEGGDADLNLLSLEQYEEAVQAGEINAYKGKQYKTAAERYAAGWRFNMETRRWQRLEGSQKWMQHKLKLQTSQLEEKVANLVRKEELHRALNHALESSLKETLSKAEASASQTHSQGKSLFIVFDTNCFLDAQSLEQVQCLDSVVVTVYFTQQLVYIACVLARARDKPRFCAPTFTFALCDATCQLAPGRTPDGVGAGETMLLCDRKVKTFMDKLKRRHRVLDNLKKVEDTKEAGASQEVPSYKRMLLPREVVAELDYKKNCRDANKAYLARTASRFLLSLVESRVLRMQREAEGDLQLRHDDSILDCCLRFAGLHGGTGTPGAQISKVMLCTDDRDLRIRGKAEGLRVVSCADLPTVVW
ncbi:hypothetical protein CYMTET_3543 [Cymbomonas tetramitiformis]|uniref:PIN domain-containing protein n=1 Tax=Cymbomonas tetramitiformis TaxID=36881 RepID=A0AAE0H330_9CHLO|nr:hypothetical protein CYMTET_3543 [Cymbomonas tetramitiformis]